MRPVLIQKNTLATDGTMLVDKSVGASVVLDSDRLVLQKDFIETTEDVSVNFEEPNEMITAVTPPKVYSERTEAVSRAYEKTPVHHEMEIKHALISKNLNHGNGGSACTDCIGDSKFKKKWLYIAIAALVLIAVSVLIFKKKKK